MCVVHITHRERVNAAKNSSTRLTIDSSTVRTSCTSKPLILAWGWDFDAHAYYIHIHIRFCFRSVHDTFSYAERAVFMAKSLTYSTRTKWQDELFL